MLSEKKLKETFALPPITVRDSRTGEVRDLNNDTARELIAYGAAIETIPSDPARAEKWFSDLRNRVVSAAPKDRLEAFEKYEIWCKSRGYHALPVIIDNLVLYLLERARDGEDVNAFLRHDCISIAVVHDLTRHPPRLLSKKAWNAYIRAISFAKYALKDEIAAIVELAERAPAKAIEMFPDGNVPMRWNDVAA